MKSGEKLKLIRKHSKNTQEQIGEYIGVSQKKISYFELGTYEPTPEELTKIANYFDVPVDLIKDDQLDLIDGLEQIIDKYSLDMAEGSTLKEAVKIIRKYDYSRPVTAILCPICRAELNVPVDSCPKCKTKIKWSFK